MLSPRVLFYVSVLTIKATVIYALVHLKGVSQQKQKSLNYPNLLLIVRPVHPCDEIHFPVFTLLLELTKYDSFEGDKDTDHEFYNFHGACSSHWFNINIQIWGHTYVPLRNHYKFFALGLVKRFHAKILMVRHSMIIFLFKKLCLLATVSNINRIVSVMHVWWSILWINQHINGLVSPFWNSSNIRKLYPLHLNTSI